MGRIRKSVDFGYEIHVTNIMAPMYGNHKGRSRKVKDTCKAVKKINENHSIEICEAKLKMNFRPYDWHIALTYSDENYTEDFERVKKDKRNFLTKLSRRCKKLGINLKYLTMTEKGVRSKKWHHHFVLPQEITIALMGECWPFGQIRILNTLYANGDFSGLAKYYVDKTKGGQKEDDREKGCSHFRFSNNCTGPKVTYEALYSYHWLKTPRAPQGYYVKPGSVYEGTDPFGSYPYQKYILVRKE